MIIAIADLGLDQRHVVGVSGVYVIMIFGSVIVNGELSARHDITIIFRELRRRSVGVILARSRRFARQPFSATLVPGQISQQVAQQIEIRCGAPWRLGLALVPGCTDRRA